MFSVMLNSDCEKRTSATTTAHIWICAGARWFASWCCCLHDANEADLKRKNRCHASCFIVSFFWSFSLFFHHNHMWKHLSNILTLIYLFCFFLSKCPLKCAWIWVDGTELSDTHRCSLSFWLSELFFASEILWIHQGHARRLLAAVTDAVTSVRIVHLNVPEVVRAVWLLKNVPPNISVFYIPAVVRTELNNDNNSNRKVQKNLLTFIKTIQPFWRQDFLDKMSKCVVLKSKFMLLHSIQIYIE